MMHVLSLLFVVFACTASISLSSPLPAPSHQNPPSGTDSLSDSFLHTFNTSPKPTQLHSIRPTLYRHHRDVRKVQQPRDVAPYTRIFWAFGDSEPIPSDLPSAQEVLESLSSDATLSSPLPSDASAPTPPSTWPSPIQQMTPTPDVTLIPFPSPTADMAPPLNVNPVFEPPRLPQASLPIPSSSSSPDASRTTFINPEVAAKISHKHKIVYVAVVVGTISGLGITISICSFLAKAGLCGCGGRKFTGAGRVDDREKRLSWMRLSSPPANFGPGCLITGVGTYGRLYDEKGVERTPNHKGVSFEDEAKIIDIGHEEFIEPDLRTLVYHAPSNNLAAASAVPGIPKQSALGLKVGQTLNPAHFTTIHLTPTSFFDNDDHIVSASPSRLSNVSSAHSRTKSAPVMTGNEHERRESNKSGGALSSASSEWDVARAYGGPRYDKARSAGAMSGLSVDEREWERTHQCP
ncbi:hypothetical protein PILCRDRAFT_825215 [Piloderma croceum F 1598]|uniref:Uncharacterized protein n=1 Tax=Piloderma croceum (strain F 1598) TaxID=765440 RepID=A0A0C3BJX0_PILCF|nr:hypothetical protein PILCRDRAFT_825215 [Piloderma croceum F 1598]